MSLLGILAGIAVLLTCLMFATRERMLGFPCAIFWIITGAQAYTLSATPWGDIYYYIFIASALGMTTFCILASFALRERRDTLADEELEKGEGTYVDEAGGGKETDLLSEEPEPKLSKRTLALRKRAEDRRTRL